MVAEILTHHFGWSGQLTELNAETDRLFLARRADGEASVLRLADLEDQGFHLQIAALDHIAKHDPGLRVPAVLRTCGQEPIAVGLDSAGRRYGACLMTFLEGGSLAGLPPNKALFWNIGDVAARLHRTLAQFEHPALGRRLVWSFDSVADIYDRIQFVGHAESRVLIAKALTELRERGPELQRLRRQPIHNDLNPSNLLGPPMASQGIGIVDFGDLVSGPAIWDIAVAASYQIARTDAPLGGGTAVVAGYDRHQRLTEAELAMLPLLIALRCAQSIVIGSWRAASRPADKGYLTRNLSGAIAALGKLASVGEARAIALLRRECEEHFPDDIADG